MGTSPLPSVPVVKGGVDKLQYPATRGRYRCTNEGMCVCLCVEEGVVQ